MHHDVDPAAAAVAAAAAAAATSPPATYRLTIPPFYADEPKLWFSQVEGQFTIYGITNDALKFATIQAQLTQTFAREVSDIFLDPPATDKYATLKRELIKRLSKSQQEKTRLLLQGESLAGRAPTQFLRHLRSLAGTSVDDDVLRTIWMQSMPSDVQSILATMRGLPLEQVAETADEVMQTRRGSHPSSQVCSSSASAPPDEQNVGLKQQVMELTAVVAALARKIDENDRQGRRSDGRDQSRNRRQFRTRSKSRNLDYCWFHDRFGNQARNCKQPCAFSKN